MKEGTVHCEKNKYSTLFFLNSNEQYETETYKRNEQCRAIKYTLCITQLFWELYYTLFVMLLYQV